MATKRSYSYLIGKFITNAIRSISGLDVGDFVASVAHRVGIMAAGYPTPTTISTSAGVSQIINCTGAAFHPPTGGLSVVGGAMNLPLAGLYVCNYKLNCTPGTGGAVITLELWADSGSGFAPLPLSAIVNESAGGDVTTASGSYTINATVDNTKVAIYVKTTAAETLNSASAYATFLSLPLVES